MDRCCPSVRRPLSGGSRNTHSTIGFHLLVPIGNSGNNGPASRPHCVARNGARREGLQNNGAPKKKRVCGWPPRTIENNSSRQRSRDTMSGNPVLQGSIVCAVFRLSSLFFWDRKGYPGLWLFFALFFVLILFVTFFFPRRSLI